MLENKKEIVDLVSCAYSKFREYVIGMCDDKKEREIKHKTKQLWELMYDVENATTVDELKNATQNFFDTMFSLTRENDPNLSRLKSILDKIDWFEIDMENDYHNVLKDLMDNPYE